MKVQFPIYEPGLEDMMRRNMEKKRLFFTSDLKEGIEGAEVIFIAVGTPPGEDGSADLRHVISVAEEIGSAIKIHTVVVTKSTVPVGTSEKIKESHSAVSLQDVNRRLLSTWLQIPNS